MSSGPACLLIHGFGGAPFEMLPLVEALQGLCPVVSVPTLPGHDTTVEDWSRTSWDDWLEAVDQEYRRLEKAHSRVFVMGLSMGGSLALALAQRHSPAGVAVFAAAVYLYRFFPFEASDWRLPLTPVLRKIRPIWPKKPGSGKSRAIAPWQGYEQAVALNPLYSMIQGLKQVRRDLGKIKAPLLAVHSPLDSYVPFANAWEIVRRASSRERNLVVLNIEERVTGHHMLTTHQETKDTVAGLARRFVAEQAGQGKS